MEHVMLRAFNTRKQAQKYVRGLKKNNPNYKKAKIIIHKEKKPKWWSGQWKFAYHVYVKAKKPMKYYT